jgi:TolB-like protein
MGEERVQRRLAAILAADVVGFSRLMEADESGTMAALKVRRKDVLDPLVAKHQGRIFKTTGDGVLIEFASAVNAVQCAVDLQQGMAAANSDVPDSHHIVLRIGINLGDVMVEGSDLYGDGVNIAARLETLAEPGGILMSGTAFDYVKNKVKVSFDDLGGQILKNFAEPVRTYRVAGAPAVAIATSKLGNDKPSIAVLPFDNMSGDPEQSYFSDGITEDIITELSKFREFLVIARNSSFQFRGKVNDVRDVAKKLGVQFVVEGSVRKSGNRLRITSQLIEAESNTHVWAERYDRELTDIFAIQDEITQMIVSRLARQTRSAIAYRGRAKPTSDLTAFEHFLRALQVMARYDTHLQAERPLLDALTIDPNFAAAHALLSITEVNKYFRDLDADHLRNAIAIADKALSLDPNEPLGHCATGFALMFLNRYGEAEPYLEQAAFLNHNDVFVRGIWALLKCFSGRNQEAFSEIEEMLRRDPFAVDWLWDIRGTIETHSGRCRDAIASYGKARALAPWSLCYLIICHAELGELDRAKVLVKRLKNEIGERTPEQVFDQDAAMNPALFRRFLDAMRQAEADGNGAGTEKT